MAHKEALYYDKIDDSRVRCRLCPHRCVIAPGKRGRCRVRVNEDATLYSTNYGRITSAVMDPIEKKPLYHFHPGKSILSLGTLGCNFSCPFCQNYTIAQMEAPTRSFSSTDAVSAAIEHDSIGIAYTYNEPFVWFEYVLETARLARDSGLKNVLVTNGYVEQEPLLEILPFVEAMNIDIKSIRPEFYEELVKGRLEPVLETCRSAAERCHVEITNLVIPTHNDTDEDFEKLASWISGNIGRMTPVHLSAYYPCHKLQAPPTPRATLERAHNIFTKHLDFVYLGNVSSETGADTACPDCGSVLVSRTGYRSEIKALNAEGACSDCGTESNIVV